MTEILPSSRQEKMAARFSVFTPASLRRTTRIARMQLTPWHKKVAHATPATPILKAVTKRISTAMLEVEDAARKMKGVLESPSAEKIPVAIL